jgi:hypothetical protein
MTDNSNGQDHDMRATELVAALAESVVPLFVLLLASAEALGARC